VAGEKRKMKGSRKITKLYKMRKRNEEEVGKVGDSLAPTFTHAHILVLLSLYDLDSLCLPFCL
jgi:hypothetical protein